jgi:arsenate reductase
LDISAHTSKSVLDYLLRVHLGTVSTVCSNAEERCRIFPFSTQRLYWPFEAPAAFVGTAEDTLTKFREVRDLISARLQVRLTEQGLTPRRLPTLQSAP